MMVQSYMEEFNLAWNSVYQCNRLPSKKAPNWREKSNRIPGQKGTTAYQGKREQQPIRAKGNNCLSWQKGTTAYQGKREQLPIMAKGKNSLSGQKDTTAYQGKMD